MVLYDFILGAINTLKIQATNKKFLPCGSGINAGLVFALIQNKSQCFNCPYG